MDLREFKKRKLTFRGSGSLSFSGFYFLQRSSSTSTCLKIKPKCSNKIQVLKEFKSTRFDTLHQYDNMLCSVATEGPSGDVYLFQYDLQSANVHRFELNTANWINDKLLVYADRKNLYALSQYENKNDEVVLRLSLFRRDKKFSIGFLVVYGGRSFNVLGRSRNRKVLES